MGTSSGFCSSRNCTRDTSLVPLEKETPSIAGNGSDAKERGGDRLHWYSLNRSMKLLCGSGSARLVRRRSHWGRRGEKWRGGTLATDVNAGGSDATIAVMRSHNADLGTSSDGAGGDSFTRLGVAGARCRMDRD